MVKKERERAIRMPISAGIGVGRVGGTVPGTLIKKVALEEKKKE